MNIVKATLDDAHAIAEVHVLSARDAYRGLVDAECLEKFAADADSWTKSIEAPSRCVFVLRVDEQIQGFVEAAPGANAEAELYNLFLAPGLQGKGLGAALLSKAVACLLDQGMRTMFLFAAVGLSRAEALYTRAGGRAIELVNMQLVPGCMLEAQQWKWDVLADVPARVARP